VHQVEQGDVILVRITDGKLSAQITGKEEMADGFDS